MTLGSHGLGFRPRQRTCLGRDPASGSRPGQDNPSREAGRAPPRSIASMTHLPKAPRVRGQVVSTSARMLKRNRAAVAVVSFLLVQASILVLFSGGVPPASAAPEELCPDGVCAASDRILLPRVIVGCWQLLERNPRPEAAVETLLSYARAGIDSFGTALLPPPVPHRNSHCQGGFQIRRISTDRRSRSSAILGAPVGRIATWI